MEILKTNEKEYKIIILYDQYSLNLSIKNIKSKIEDKIKYEYESIKIDYIYNFKKYFKNFKDLIDKIKQEEILLKIEEKLNEDNTNIKYLNLNIINNNKDNIKKIISKKINKLNVEYYLTYGPNNQRLNSKPFLYYLTKDDFNNEDVLELIDKEKTLRFYEIDSFRYFDNNKRVFQKINKINNENISIEEKLILEFHFNSSKNYFIKDLYLARKYIK